MSKKIFISLLIVMLLLNFEVVFAQNNKAKLAEVRKIYIQQSEDKKYDKFYENLTAELRRKLVFTVVPTVEEADSILKIEFLIELIIHNEKDWDNPVFRCNLFTKKDELIWKKDITIDTKGDIEADNQLTAKIIADKLVKDWIIAERKRKK